MTKEVVSTQLGKGGSGIPDNLPNIVRELAGLSVAVVAGATAGTAMNVAAMRQEDTILSAIAVLDAAGSANTGVNDAANCTIQSTRATGTLTVASVIDGSSAIVNGFTYTFKDVPTALGHVLRTAGNNNANAAALAAAITSYESRYTGTGYVAAVTAVAVSAVVTVSSAVDGLGNGVVLTGTATVLAAAGTGTASATLTPATVVATNTFVLAGVTFTARAAPTLDNEFMVKGTDALQGAEVARAINYYQGKYGTLDASATAQATTGVVTIVPIAPKAGNIIVLTGTVSVLAASGSGTLAGGTNTGSFKSTTDLSSKTVTVTWFNKR